MILLVAGGARVDAGKTTFSAGLVERTGATGFKPRAGNDYWHDHDDYRRAVDGGRMYGKDARRLADASPGERAPEGINPVHRLWRPAPGGTGLLGQSGREFVLDRVGDGYVVNGTADVPPEAREKLPLDGATVVESLEELNRVMEDRHVPLLRAFGERIDDHDLAVVESYADVARPIETIGPDAVAVVEPGRCRVYDGPRYARACDVAGGSPVDGRLETRIDEALELVEPAATVELPALAEGARSDPAAVADAYGEAYDALLSA